MTLDVVNNNTGTPSAVKEPRQVKKRESIYINLDVIRAEGYFDIEVRHLLKNGMEEQLYDFLKFHKLLPNVMNCPNEGCNERALDWKKSSRNIDKYTWECSECKKKQSLREKSIFFKVQCDIRICLQLMLAWCKSMYLEDAADLLDTKNFKVKKLYERLDRVAETYVDHHISNWPFGGTDDKIVIVDEYPIGCMSEELEAVSIPTKHRFLCIVEVDPTRKPPKSWVHIIHSKIEIDKKGKCVQKSHMDMLQEVLFVVQKMILPESIVLANNRSPLCNYQSLTKLECFRVFSVDFLRKYDLPNTNHLIKNLETIWGFAKKLCDDVQKMSYPDAVSHIKTSQYKQCCCQDPSAGFYQILLHISKTSEFK